MKVIVVGGGTAGWVSLAYLSATTNAELTIIHSEEVDNLGVGESTTPTIKHVAEVCGIDEVKWMKNAKASYKYGIEFIDFNKIGSRWLHNFDDLLPGQSFHTPTTEFGKNIFKKDKLKDDLLKIAPEILKFSKFDLKFDFKCEFSPVIDFLRRLTVLFDNYMEFIKTYQIK